MPGMGMVAGVSITSGLSITAIIVSVAAIAVSLFTFYRETEQADYEYLANTWYKMIEVADDFPEFLDASVTTNYVSRLSPIAKTRYDIYCRQNWGFVEDLVVKRFQDNPQYRAFIVWMVAYHLVWLQRNPTLYSIEEFWKVVEDTEQNFQLTMRRRILPETPAGAIDWAVVSQDYFNYVLSPFAPEMVVATSTVPMRNRLLDDLLKLDPSQLRSAAIADFGSGGGNLLTNLGKHATKVVCVDQSARALAISQRAANAAGIVCEIHQENLRSVRLNQTFDIIVSSNAILPPTRLEVSEMLETIREHLKPNGVLYAILPAYDTTVYSRQLWHDYYSKVIGSKQADRIDRAIKDYKRADDKTLSYADDGQVSQCWHDWNSIHREFPGAGLKLCRDPVKIRYPWALVRHFDYGYFPNATQEIWDWYVVAMRDDA